jgi:hypothetical protein
MRSFLVALSGLFLGIIPAIFIVFSGVFTDSSSITERLVSLSITFAVYAILGFIFSSWSRLHPGILVILLCLPAAVILTWYSIREAAST